MTQMTNIESPKFASFDPEKKVSYVQVLNPKAEANKGFRISEIRYRTAENKVAKQARMMEIPVCDVSYLFIPSVAGDTEQENQELSNAMQVMKEAIEAQQDNYIRAQIDRGLTCLHWEELEVSKMLAELTAESVSKRLTKELIEQWFANHAISKVTDRALEIVMNKNVDPDSDAGKQNIANIINNYKEKMMKLAATIPGLNEKEATALQTMMQTIDSSDPVAVAMSKKLTTLLKPQLANDEL